MTSLAEEQRRDRDRGTCRSHRAELNAGRCQTCRGPLIVYGKDNRVGCFKCHTVLSCSNCRGWKDSHVAAVEELCEEILKVRAEMESATGSERYRLSEKLQLLTNFTCNAHEVKKGKPIVLHERRSHNVTGFLFWRRHQSQYNASQYNASSNASSERKVSCICGYTKSIAGANYGDQQAAHVARAISEDRVSALMYPAFCGNAGPTDDALLRSIKADCSIEVASAHTMFYSRPVIISTKAWHLIKGSEKLETADTLALKLLDMDLPPRVLLSKATSAFFEKQLVFHKWCTEHFEEYKNPFFSERYLLQIFLLNAFIENRKQYDSICGETVHLFDMLQHQMNSFKIGLKKQAKSGHCLGADLLKSMCDVVEGDLTGEKALILHSILPVHHCQLHIETTDFAMPYMVRECFDETFQVSDGLQLPGCSYVELLESSCDVILRYERDRVFFLTKVNNEEVTATAGVLSFAAQHGPFTSTTGAEFSTAFKHIEEDESRLMVFQISITGREGRAFCEDYIVSGVQRETVYTCKAFTIPTSMCPGLTLPDEFEIEEVGRTTRVTFLCETKRQSMEKAVLQKLNRKIIAPSEFLCRCSASRLFNEDESFQEIDNEKHRELVKAAHQNNRLTIFYERGRRSRLYYRQRCLDVPFRMNTNCWTSKAARRYIRERLATMGNGHDYGMRTVSIDVGKELTLRVTISDGNIVCATVTASKLLERDGAGAFKHLIEFDGFPLSVRCGSREYCVDVREPSAREPLKGELVTESAEIRTDFYTHWLRKSFQVRKYKWNYYICAYGLGYKIMNERNEKLPLCASLGAPLRETLSSMLRMYRVQLSMTTVNHHALRLKQSRIILERMADFKAFTELYQEDFERVNVALKNFGNRATLCQVKSTETTFHFDQSPYAKRKKTLLKHQSMRYYTLGMYTESRSEASVLFPGVQNGEFVGKMKMNKMPAAGDDKKPNFPFGFRPIYRNTSSEITGAEFTRKLFFPCSRSRLRDSDVLALLAYGYIFCEGVKHWNCASGMYLQSRVHEWLNMVRCWEKVQSSKLRKHIDTTTFNANIPSITISFKTTKFVSTATPMDDKTAALCLQQASSVNMTKDEFFSKHSLTISAGATDSWYTNIMSFLEHSH